MTAHAVPHILPDPPQAHGLPLVGVLPEVWKDPLGFFLNTAIKYGNVVRIDLGPRPMILVSHPDPIKYILQDNNKNFVKGYEMVKPLMGEGLVSSDGELWLRQRRLIQPLFNRSNLVGLLPMMVQAVQETFETWNNRPNPEEPIDIAAEMMLLTQTIILRTMFSADMGNRSKTIAADFATSLEYLNTMLMSPSPILQRLPTSTNRRFKDALQRLDAIVYQIITDRRKQGDHSRNDLLAVLIEARDPETGQGMSDSQIRDEVMTIFLAGHETTATLLAWTWYLLGQSPPVETRLRAEVDQVLQGHTANAEEINQLVYMRQVLDEALRLYPPAWMFARRLVSDDEIGGFHLAAGQTIMLSPWVTQHLSAFWPDPFSFNPDRFTPEASAARPRFAYFPFGGGPRQCVGMSFTLLEAPLLLSMILQHFRLEPVLGQVVKPTPQATLRPKPGVFMRIKPL